MEGLGAKFSRGHRHRCWTVVPITGIEEAPCLRWGYGGLGQTGSAEDSLGPSYIKAKGCAEKEKYKTDPPPLAHPIQNPQKRNIKKKVLSFVNFFFFFLSLKKKVNKLDCQQCGWAGKVG